MTRDEIADTAFDGDFGISVWVRRAQGAAFGDGDHVGEARGVAVDGGRGGEDDVGHGVARHAAQQAEGAVDVGVVVREGDEGGFADGLDGKRGRGLVEGFAVIVKGM